MCASARITYTAGAARGDARDCRRNPSFKPMDNGPQPVKNLLPSCEPQAKDNVPMPKENLPPACEPQAKDNGPQPEENLPSPCEPHTKDNGPLPVENLPSPCEPQAIVVGGNTCAKKQRRSCPDLQAYPVRKAKSIQWRC